MLGRSGRNQQRFKTTVAIKDLEKEKIYNVDRLKVVNTRFGKKVVVEVDGDKQFFLPDRMNKSIISNIDEVDSISTNHMTIRYLGMVNGCYMVD